MFFDPSAPIATTMTVATLAAVLLSIRNNYQLALALLVSLVGARLLTYYDASQWHGLIMVCCVFLSVCDFTKGKPWFLDVKENEVNYLFSVIYIPRTVLVIVAGFGLISIELMWLMSIFFLVIQVGLVVGASINGYKLNSSIYRYRSIFSYTLSKALPLNAGKTKADGY